VSGLKIEVGTSATQVRNVAVDKDEITAAGLHGRSRKRCVGFNTDKIRISGLA
jgi:hypothetical protein